MKNLQDDPIFEQLFAQIPSEITDTFTDDQLVAIKTAFSSRNSTRHPLVLRVSSPIPGLRFYLVLLGGRECRSKQSLQYERGVYPLRTPGNIMFFIGVLLVLSLSTFTTLPSLLSLFTDLSTLTHPTSIPWIHNKSECIHTGRKWRDGECWDSEHSDMF
jgi:hypothetical protein